MKEKCKLFGRIIIFVFCIGVMLFGAMFVMHKDQDKEELLKIANPVTEVKSLNEMKKYLGYEVPLIGEKEVSKYIVIGKGKVANHGRIIYKDKSEFDMEKGKLDVSGIYGGKKLSEESIGGVKVTLYSYEDIIYATWSYQEYSYSYSMVGNDQNALKLDVNKIIRLVE